mmetsp:Transcript_108215/g.301719  ORF Transcript_108215/g.301719 Transcript_108215/m.301719 type:complete len:302 (-) Transcript_108215:97-1002(-)
MRTLPPQAAAMLTPTGHVEHVPMAATDSELESAAWLSHPAAQASAASGRTGVAKVAFLLCMGCTVGFIAYGASPTKAPGPHAESTALSFNVDGIVQKSETTHHTCPAGYMPTHLDMMNHDPGATLDNLSPEACAEKCDKDEQCKGFEHNKDANHCFITHLGHHLTDKQHPHWESCKKIPDGAECPAGYNLTELDMMNHDPGATLDNLSPEACAEKCDKDEQCKGFEHNKDANHCFITHLGHHLTDKQHPHWVSCKKTATADSLPGSSTTPTALTLEPGTTGAAVTLPASLTTPVAPTEGDP